MIGFYNYTMWLTYASLTSAVIGIFVSLSGAGHPYIGMYFLMLSGLCDAFDGRVARKKKNRSSLESKFGVQADSLSDIVAFGILPCAIGVALYRRSHFISDHLSAGLKTVLVIIAFVIMAVFAICALIRLGYYNATEDERRDENTGAVKFYTGLPVTSSAVIFPTVLLLNFLFTKAWDIDLVFLYFIVMAIMAVCFVLGFRLKKPGTVAIYVMLAVGIIEAILLIVIRKYFG